MKSKLISVLEKLGYPVYLQDSLLDDEPYPDSFITFWTVDSDSAADFDNETACTAWLYSVANYSSSPANVEKMAHDIRTALKAAGFIPQGKGRDLPSDQPTHTGWVCEYYYLEYEGVL